MNTINLILGFLLIVAGAILVILYRELKPKQKGALSFKIQTGGMGLIIIGVWIIINELYVNF